MLISRLDNADDFEMQRKLVQLYRPVFPITAVMHQALTGAAGMWIYVAEDMMTGVLLGAGILKSSEAVVPVGPDVKPLAWAISDMVTHAEHRRRGIALALLERMCDAAQRNGGRIVYLYTDNTNDPAIRLYEKAGFERLGDQSRQAVFARLVRG